MTRRIFKNGKSTSTIQNLFRAVADALRAIMQPTWYGSPAYLAMLEAEHRDEQTHEEALRRRYNANFHQAEIDVRAARHRIKFSLTALPHHRAAVLDFLDDPTAPTHLTPMHASWFQALDEDGKATFTMAHPTNRAAFLITSRYAARYGWQSEHYTTERAKWSPEQWLDFESQERQQLRATRAECLATGTLKILQVRDFRAGIHRASTRDPSPR